MRRKNEPLADSTARSYLLMLGAFFNHLVRENKVRNNPAAGVERARLELRVRREFCDSALLQKLIDECRDRELQFVLFCGFHAGMSKEEI